MYSIPTPSLPPMTLVGSNDPEWEISWINLVEKTKAIEELKEQGVEVVEEYTSFLIVRAQQQPTLSIVRVEKPSFVPCDRCCYESKDK